MLIQNVLGKINISHDAISKIVGKTASATSGIAAMATGVVEGITKKLSGKSLQNGIELKIVEAKLEIDLKIIVYYGVKMQDVCSDLQQNVRGAIETLTGLSIHAVNVRVQGIALKE